MWRDEDRPLGDEGRDPEDMVGMGVGGDDVANGLRRPRPQGGEEGLALDQAAAGVDHGHGVVADDGADIGDIAFVFARHHRDLARMGENAGGDLLQVETYPGAGERRQTEKRYRKEEETRHRGLAHLKALSRSGELRPRFWRFFPVALLKAAPYYPAVSGLREVFRTGTGR